MSTKKLCNTMNPLKSQQDTEVSSHISFIFHFNVGSNPKEVRITKSLVNLSNKVESLKEKIERLDKKIKESY